MTVRDERRTFPSVSSPVAAGDAVEVAPKLFGEETEQARKR